MLVFKSIKRFAVVMSAFTAFVSVPVLSTPIQASAQTLTASYRTSTSLPPDVRYDSSIRTYLNGHWHNGPIAGRNATWQQKYNAVLAVAKSQLGVPYVWGHQVAYQGFDCSNFTAYVYHHALGYKMSGASQTQNHYVGWRVPKSSMRPGDLLIFENGKHVGIYIGNDKMIEEGGGLGKVGYLSVRPGTYWGNHITAVKRMF